MTLSAKVDSSSDAVDTEPAPLLNVTLYDKLARQEGLMTITAQAVKHGVRRPYWSEIHNRLRSPSFKLARKVAAQLGVPTDALWNSDVSA